MRPKSKKHQVSKTIFNSIDQVNQELQKPVMSLRVLGAIFLIAVILIGIVWQKVHVAKLALEIEQLEKEKHRLEEEISALNAKALKLSDGKRVIKIAEEKLNMIMPDSEILPVKHI
ncbi:MAG: cell division protein FtsL, partial [bacterium]|nr:cell division protein FtsL [bacterium]